MSAAIDIVLLLDNGRWTAYQKALTALTAFAIMFDGFDIQILGFAIPSLMKEWHLARPAFGPVLAIGLAGMVVGSPLAGYLGDRFGRRPALIGCLTLFSLATLSTAFVNSIVALAVLRFITGLGTGGTLPNASALVAEFAPLRMRATAVNLTVVCIPLGGMLGGVIAAGLLPTHGWRALYCIGGGLPLALIALLWVLLPESPHFLAQDSRRWPALERLLHRMGRSVASNSTFHDKDVKDDKKEGRSCGRTPISALLGSVYIRDTLGLWLAFLSCLGGIYLVFGWLPAMLSAQGLGIASASQSLAVYNLGGVFGVFVWAILMKTLGSRGPLLWGALAAAGSALAILLVPIGSGGSHTLLWGALALNGLLSNAVQTSMYALAAHVYPTSIRASGIAYAAAAGRAGGIVSSICGASIIGMGRSGYWLALAGSMTIAFAGLAWVRSHFPAVARVEHNLRSAE